MNLSIGDFIIHNLSFFPSLVIQKNDNIYLITVKEYNGDYIWIDENKIVGKVSLTIEEKLSIVSNYYNDFYLIHKNIINEFIIEGLITLMH